MKPTQFLFHLAVLVAMAALTGAAAGNQRPIEACGPGEAIATPTQDDGRGGTILANHDGSFENGYIWQGPGVAPPDYGAWAECYDGDWHINFVQFWFTQLGNQAGETMDVYVWDDEGDNPGNVLAYLPGVDPGPIALWPSVSLHSIPVNVDVAGTWWVGFWPDWPGQEIGAWFIASDENGFPGCPRTKFAPGIGYPTGWGHVNLSPTMQDCQSLGIQAFVKEEGWIKMTPPPDVDKAFHGHVGTGTCWQATAANMLAGAGYGVGATVQQRADAIYLQMVANFGLGGGWVDNALQWWLGSGNNVWPNNPYTVVTVYGNKIPKNPWANPNGARFIGNELRRCQFVGLSISWPVAGAQVGTGGHAITGWGDDGGANPLPGNPSQVKVTDSDRDTGGDVQTYNYDAYNNPNPGGPNEGNGWYIDYNNNHPYIKHIVTLCPTDDPGDDHNTQKVKGSKRIHQGNDIPATDLHYRVGTDVDILSYKTTIDWQTDNPPNIIEVGNPPHELIVDWDLTDNPVPYCTWVTITTEFVVPSWNAIYYTDVYFTYPFGPGPILPGFRWEIMTPPVPDPDLPDITGGFVVGTYNAYEPVLRDDGTRQLLSSERLLHQYSYFQNPEQHQFVLEVSEPGAAQETYWVDDINFGHSYGYLPDSTLWQFEEWMSSGDPQDVGPGMPMVVDINWDGQLPYPPGENYIAADFDYDGDVDLDDWEFFTNCYTGEGVPADPECDQADFDRDGDVDCDDYEHFVASWTEPGEPPHFPPCASSAPSTEDRGELFYNVPSPFHAGSVLEFSLAEPQHVTISVYRMDGRRIAVLTDGRYGAGVHSIAWDGRDSSGRTVFSSAYIIRIETEDRSEARKVILVR